MPDLTPFYANDVWDLLVAAIVTVPPTIAAVGALLVFWKGRDEDRQKLGEVHQTAAVAAAAATATKDQVQNGHTTKYRDDFDGMNHKIDLLVDRVDLIQTNMELLNASHLALVKRLQG
ncbi:hypothetical protein [Mycobacteroides abscessus]|uniref:Uncharacterized protein n=1 Tax=Mycobacteroides abscessus subsp. massiliense TaxID=1962118 RepID=A0A1U2CG02_9MYCO|nr:hypothetical protein [Mycobacteroides abscessus]SKM29660.1 Uncharacterised protein [Mycobacteroides abscessus subsp. massiliense]SKT32940.1 Uncharacterised protein [Mycobacteroides abscessus subsp. massiliense]SKT69809.1 Uncharacterised protein [Mycobacteroides abscessus subsp. massiliense]SKX08396.1 Uncharacterised protein [Mycobacteroides abscessus subsp. massiliense]